MQSEEMETTDSTVLHYIYDPMCGWCYGAAPLVRAARELLHVRAHAGGMMVGGRRQTVNDNLRNFVLQHDRQVARITGQPFGEAYIDSLLRDTSAVFDSEPPIAAILTAETLNGQGLDMLARLQTAHYVEGRRIADQSVLTELAGSIGLDPIVFADTMGRVKNVSVQAHIADTRELMIRLGFHGFPSFALERNGKMEPIDTGSFMGNPEKFSEWLQQSCAITVSGQTSDFACGPDHCAI